MSSKQVDTSTEVNRRVIIVKGDALSPGGTVGETTGNLLKDGVTRIAVIGDPVTCKTHGNSVISEGHPTILSNEKPVAMHGHKTKCGCTLVATRMEEILFKHYPAPINDQEYCEDLFDKVDNNKPDFHPSKKVKFQQLADLHQNMTSGVHNVICQLRKETYNARKNAVNQKTTLDEFDKKNKPPIKKLVYKPLPGTPKDLRCEEDMGGPHNKTTKPPKDGYESHHIPPKAAYKGSKMYPPGTLTSNLGPAVKITKKDHEKTKSHPRHPLSVDYQAKQKKLVQEGRFYEALQNDIDDLRSIAADNGTPHQFECQIQQATAYANTTDPKDYIIPTKGGIP